MIASRFHAAFARGTVEACVRAASARRRELVVLSGGVFQTGGCSRPSRAGCDAAGLRVLVPERLPVGDGGISYGQAAVAARRLARAEVVADDGARARALLARPLFIRGANRRRSAS